MYQSVSEAINIFSRLSSTDIFHVVEKRHGLEITGTKWDIVHAIYAHDKEYNGDVAHYPANETSVSTWAIIEYAYSM